MGKVTMRLKTDAEISNHEMQKIYDCVSEKLPYFELEIIKVNQIEKTKRGKYKLIIQNYKK